MSKQPSRMVELRVNGETMSAPVPDRKLLSDFLREDLFLTGTHVGCEQGVCGACTILLDGQPVRSCLMLAVQAQGRSITTIEGIAGDDRSLHPVQKAFHEQHALQCGYCTPGLIVSVVSYLNECAASPEPIDDNQVREHLSGNLCRCTGYTNIVLAVRQAALEMGIQYRESA